MRRIFINNVRIVRPGEGIAAGSLFIETGKVARIDTQGAAGGLPANASPTDIDRVDGGGRLLTPGLIDIHTHGIHHYQYDAGPEHLLAAAKVLGAYGTTCVVPTLVPRADTQGLAKLERLADAVPNASGACIPGLHLEGPFVAIAGAACPTLPGDVGLLDEMIAACRGRIAVMSISPETPNILPVIGRLRERGIAAFITHTRASVEQTQAAIDAGATHATHFYDVFPVPPETEPGARPVGAVEAILADPRATVDFICDGCHVHPVAVRMALAAKGYRGVALITDSNVGAGLPPGEYDTPWGYRVRVRPGDGARHVEKGWLAGSALTMNVGIANLLRWLDLPPEQVWATGTGNPARLLGLGRKGKIEVGADADLALWNDDLTPAKTWVGGRCVYEGSDEPSCR
jgi:N-acetylglucosamine-6-phosphate deacetylase